MMRNKLFLLFAILSIFVICLASADEKAKGTDGKKAAKKIKVEKEKTNAHDTDKLEREDYEDEIDDSYSPKSSFAHNRFLSHDQSEGNYRTRSRWPSSSDSDSGLSHSLPTLPFTIGNFADDDDDEWSSAGYGSAFQSSSPAHSYGMQRMSHNSQTCSPLIDPQYPIFSDTCGAVPQARYSLPNAFGHRDRWQIAQLLNVLASSASDPACSRSTRLLLCPILFPSCPSRQQPTPVLPCQSFCRAVKSRCSIPLLESLPCEILPHTSDLCPSSQGFGSLASSRGFPHNMQLPLPMPSGHPSPSRQFSSLQSLLSAPALQAALSGQALSAGLNQHALSTGLNQQALQAALAAQAFPSLFQAQNLQAAPVQMPAAVSAPVTTPPPPPPAPTTTPMNLYNNRQFPVDTISAMLGEIPSRSFANDYRQGSRYGSGSPTSSDIRSSTNSRGSSNGRPSSMVRA